MSTTKNRRRGVKENNARGYRNKVSFTMNNTKKDRYIDIQSMVFDDLFALRSINQDGTSIE